MNSAKQSWLIGGVWHSSLEEPNDKRHLQQYIWKDVYVYRILALVRYAGGFFHARIETLIFRTDSYDTWEIFAEENHIVEWAYFDDVSPIEDSRIERLVRLIPKKEEAHV